MMTCGLTCFLALLAAEPEGPATRRLTLRPAAAPVPALRYSLQPDLGTQTPGNAALFYDRAMLTLSEGRSPADFWERLNKWLEVPLAELPAAEVRTALAPYASVFHELTLAAHCRHCDWQLDFRTEGIELLLPEIQRMRNLIVLVALEARVRLADGRVGEALSWIETGFAMARHAGDGPTLIHSLVGIALANLMCDRLEELVQRPGAPNLYWSLTDLPRPLVNLRVALEGEKALFLKGLVPPLAELEATPLTAEQARLRFAKLLNALGEGGAGTQPRADAALLLLTAKFYPTAKQDLIRHGVPSERVEAMAPLQAVVIFSVRRYLQARDDQFKWITLPYWQAAPGLHRATDELKRMRADMREGLPIASTLLPATDRVARASALSERRLAVLRTLEALRLYAAGHDGRLPATLDALAPVPVPADPVTGQPFEYRAEGDRATLSAPPPAGEKPESHNSIRFEITMHR